jgi:hypothetical protein
MKMLSREKRLELGKIIVSHYINESGISMPLHKAYSKEPEGTFMVLSYPKIYNHQMDKLIASYCQKFSRPKRKRILLKK